MAQTVSTGFKVTSKEAMDLKQYLTKSEMLSEKYDTSRGELIGGKGILMPSPFFCLCKDDGKFYMYKKDAGETPSAETGYFKPLEDCLVFKTAEGEAAPAVEDAIKASATIKDLSDDVGDIADAVDDILDGGLTELGGTVDGGLVE